MVQRIQLPDGSIAEFPDDFTDDQITEVIQTDLSSRRAEGGQSSGVSAPPLSGDAGAGPTLDPAGNPIDLNRPMVRNDDGGFSTERTISISDADGTTFLIPTLINGEQVSNEEAERLFRSGGNPSVGTFDSVEEAQVAAEARSQRIGELRRDEQNARTFTRNFTDDPNDPLRTVPIEIGGVTLTQDIREAILAGRSVRDPVEQGLLAARIGGRIAAGEPNPNAPNFFQGVALGDPNTLGTLLRGLGTGIFGLGDFAGAAGVALAAPELTFGQALQFQREFRRAKEEAALGTSLAGEVSGAILGGSGFLNLLRTASKGTALAPVVEKATVFTRSEGGKGFVKNVGRASLAGGTAGGITEGVSEGEALQGIGIGILAGPLGVGIQKAAQIGLPAARRFLLDPASKGLRVMAKQLNKTPEEMSLRFLRFQAVTGRKPTMADIMNDEAAAELNAMIANRTSAATIAREGAEAASARRPVELAEDITGGRVTTTQRTQEAARDRLAREQFAETNKEIFVFQPDEVQSLLVDPDLRRAIPPSLRRQLDEVLSKVPEGSPAELTGLMVNDIREALNKAGRGAVGADRVFIAIREDLENIARAQSKKFGTAIDEFSQRSTRGENVDVGRSALNQDTSEARAIVDTIDPSNPLANNVGAGIRVGARSGLEDAAREGAEQASRLSRRLSDDTGLLERLRAVLPAREVTRLQELGTMVARSARNVGALGPAIKAEQQVMNEVVGEAVDAIAISAGAQGAFRANFITRQLLRLLPSRSKKTMENVARDLFDPEKTGEALAAMRRMGLSEGSILDLFVGGMTAGTLATTP